MIQSQEVGDQRLSDKMSENFLPRIMVKIQKKLNTVNPRFFHAKWKSKIK